MYPTVGVALFAVGVFTLFVGIGIIPVAFGAVAYVLWLLRSRLLSIQPLTVVFALLGIAILTTIANWNQLIGIEFAAAAAVAVGLGLLTRALR